MFLYFISSDAIIIGTGRIINADLIAFILEMSG